MSETVPVTIVWLAQERGDVPEGSAWLGAGEEVDVHASKRTTRRDHPLQPAV